MGPKVSGKILVIVIMPKVCSVGVCWVKNGGEILTKWYRTATAEIRKLLDSCVNISFTFSYILLLSLTDLLRYIHLKPARSLN